MAIDSDIVRDGDMGFVGYSSRLNPINLPAGMLQLSENVRLDRGTAKTRKGAKRLADNISPAGVPLTVPFVLSPAPSAPIVSASYTGGILASTIMRSPDETYSIEVIVLAGPDRAFVYINDEELSNTSMFWSAGPLVDSSGDPIVTEDGDELLVTNLPSQITYPSSPDEVIEPTDSVEMVQAYDRLYLFREADITRSGWGELLTTSSGITVVGTTATVNVQAHGFTAGTRVRISGSSSVAFDGHEYDIVTATTDSFTITVPSGVASDASANIAVRRVKPPLYWTGQPGTNFVRSLAGVPDVGVTYKRLRSAPWASYINNRLIVPDGKHNVMLSDVFDPDVFDPYWQSFRLGAGGNDKLVAIHPWVDNNFLVFCRKSIWLAQVNQLASTDGSDFAINTAVSRIDLLTDEIGCSARRTIQTAGQFIYFLSDSGVYRLDARLDLKLRGETKPLSDPISDQLGSLNQALVGESVGLYFDNRYYLAVPLAGATDSNNGVFIYNQLNEQWETQDIYGFGVGNFLVTDYQKRRRVFITNRAGKLMLLDELEAGDDSPDSTANLVSPVPARIRTRRYGFNSMHAKRFVRSLADVVLPNTGSISVKAITTNPDKEITLVPGQTNISGIGEDYTLKNPIRVKAHYCELEFSTSADRPEIRNVSVEAAITGLPQTETRHAA